MFSFLAGGIYLHPKFGVGSFAFGSYQQNLKTTPNPKYIAMQREPPTAQYFVAVFH